MPENSSKPMSGADVLVQCLVNHGVEVAFAYPGGASMPIHQALTRQQNKIRVILPRHEQGGGFAAQGYARATGKVGVCVATSGPGATNFVTCLADAKMDSTPIIAITGQVPTNVIGTDAFQETPTVEICRSITKHQYLLTDPNDITRVVKEAFYIASTGRPGPVVIDVPKDISNAVIEPNYDVEMNLPGYKPERSFARKDLEDILRLISQSKKPIIYSGGGITMSGAGENMRMFAERLGIPVAQTLHGLSGFPGEHFLSVDMLGMHGSVYANYAINEADLLLGLGVRFDDRVTGKVSEFAKHGKIVHVDIDPSEINKVKYADVAIVADVKEVLGTLIDMLNEDPSRWAEYAASHQDWIKQIEAWREENPFDFEDRNDAILPQYAIRRLWEILKDRGKVDDTIVTTGVGQHQMWAAQFWKYSTPRTWITSGGLGSMGFGLPSAMGAQAAYPFKTVVDIDGDGSFLMNIQEAACCYVEKLPVKVLLLNNQHLGMVVQWEDRFYESNRGHTYLGAGFEHAPYPDFVAMTQACGWSAKHIVEKNHLDSALEEMLDTEGPYLLDVLVPYQEHVLPMIPSGMTVRDMITK
ncbi:MAG: biosynthetic-type acetolactate synthase large subunit [Gemmataceae bacterium]